MYAAQIDTFNFSFFKKGHIKKNFLVQMLSSEIKKKERKENLYSLKEKSIVTTNFYVFRLKLQTHIKISKKKTFFIEFIPCNGCSRSCERAY